MLLHISVDFPETELKILHTLEPFSIKIAPPGILLYKLVEEVAQFKPVHICETGCLRDPSPTGMMTDGWSSFYFSKFAHEHQGSKLTTIELDGTNLAYCQLFLSRFGYINHNQFIQGDSVKVISELTEHPDVFYLDSCNGLEHGLAEFQAALGHKPKLIIMDDFSSKAASAAEYANQQSIPFQQMGRFSVFYTSPESQKIFNAPQLSRLATMSM